MVYSNIFVRVSMELFNLGQSLYTANLTLAHHDIHDTPYDVPTIAILLLAGCINFGNAYRKNLAGVSPLMVAPSVAAACLNWIAAGRVIHAHRATIRAHRSGGVVLPVHRAHVCTEGTVTDAAAVVDIEEKEEMELEMKMGNEELKGTAVRVSEGGDPEKGAV